MLFGWWAATQGAALQIHCLFICAGPNSSFSHCLSLPLLVSHRHIDTQAITTYICQKERGLQIKYE